MAINPGDAADADEVINAIGANFNDTAQMIFNADYIGFDSRLTNSTTPSLKNVKYSTFTSDDADASLGFEYDAANDFYQTINITSTDYYAIIEADDDQDLKFLTSFGHIQRLSSGKWIVFGIGSTVEERRANVHRILWENGATAFLTKFTNITALKFSDSDDVGFRGYWINFDDSQGGGGTPVIRWECPSATILNSASSSTSNEIGTDTSADEKTNPSDCQIERTVSAVFTVTGTFGTTTDNIVSSWSDLTGDTNNNADAEVIIFTKGTLTWAGDTGRITDDIDFFTDHSVPVTTQASDLVTEGYTSNEATLIFKDTVTSTDNAIAVINTSIDATSSEQISISANGGSNYTDVNNAEIARPIAGTALWRRIVITRTDLSKEDKVTEQAVKFEFY